MPKFYPSDYPKYRKRQKGSKGKIVGVASERASRLAFYSFGLKALSSYRFTADQMEAVSATLRKFLGKKYPIIFRVFAHEPISEKSIGVRMGGGKGEFKKWVAFVKKGMILFEVNCDMVNTDNRLLYEAMNIAANKIPFATKIIKRIGGLEC